MFPIFITPDARDRHLIKHSARFGGSGYLSWAPGRDSSGPHRWTRSFWFKRWRIHRQETLICTGTTDTNRIDFDPEGVMTITGDGGHALRSKRLFRDTSGWTHWHEEYNSAPPHARLRRRIWINGVEETAWRVDNRAAYFSLGEPEPRFMRAGQPHTLGRGSYPGAVSGGFYVAELIALDGAAPGGPEGVTAGANIHGVWSPLNPSGLAFGANGFWFDFSRAPADGRGLGTDVSGNGNHWTEQGVTASDRARDVPVNSGDAGADDAGENFGNYATLSPLPPGRGGYVSEGGLRADQPPATGNYHASFPELKSGKWYWEVLVHSTFVNVPALGVWSSGAGGHRFDPAAHAHTAQFAGHVLELGPQKSRSLITGNTPPKSVVPGAPWNTVFNAGDRAAVALDLDNGKIWFGKNGAWLGGGDPAAGTAPAADTLDGSRWSYTPYLWVYNCAASINFGQLEFAHTPPAGFKTLNTANLPRPRVKDVNELFQAVYAPASGVESALADARRGWTDYAEIFKSREATGYWRIRFSHDAGREYTWGSLTPTADSTVRVPRAPLSGAVMTAGYAMRFGPHFGSAAGSVRHTQGAATTVTHHPDRARGTHDIGRARGTHDLGSARSVILLFRRTGTHTALMRHPDCDPGKLLTFGRRGGQRTNGAVTNVTAGSFDIAAAAPSDTYDYLVLTPESGCFAAAHYRGNGSADGPFVYMGLSPEFLCTMPAVSGLPGLITDAVRSPGNPAPYALMPEAPNREIDIDARYDRTAAGFKIRTSSVESNPAGVQYFAFAFGRPFANGGQSR